LLLAAFARSLPAKERAYVARTAAANQVIALKSLDGTSISVNVTWATGTVADLKRLVTASHGYQPKAQHIYVGGREDELEPSEALCTLPRFGGWFLTVTAGIQCGQVGARAKVEKKKKRQLNASSAGAIRGAQGELVQPDPHHRRYADNPALRALPPPHPRRR
jgi:hypothetical protein